MPIASQTTPAMPLVVKTALADQIVDVLRARIIAGALSSKAPLRQDALAAELGISKIPLREALVRLEQDGLVFLERNRGYMVRPLSADEAYDVFGLRLKIEPEAVGSAAASLTPDDIATCRASLAALNAAVMIHDARAGALNRAFHMALIRPGGRPVTLQMAERLQMIAERYVVRHLEPAGRADRASREHAALFDAWSAGDGPSAADLSASHIAATLADLKVELTRQDLRPSRAETAGSRQGLVGR